MAKRWIVILLLICMIGCVVPPEPEPESPIDCNGYYFVKFTEWGGT